MHSNSHDCEGFLPKGNLFEFFFIVQMDFEEEDWITLSGGGHITQWRFPKYSSACPVLGCRIQFRNRSEAIAHYKERHAMNAILCSICDKPIRIDTKPNGFIDHYQRLHPNVNLPNFDEIQEEKISISKKQQQQIINVFFQSSNILLYYFGN